MIRLKRTASRFHGFRQRQNLGNEQRFKQLFVFHEVSPVKLMDMQVGSLRFHSSGAAGRLTFSEVAA